MTDVLTPKQRRYCMSRVASKHTKPEIVVRELLRGLDYRYRLHVRTLPGCPDFVFPGQRKAIFVHGCFWHRHRCKRGREIPKTRSRFWQAKLEGNHKRDVKHRRALKAMGWDVMVIWQCQMRDLDKLSERIVAFLHGLGRHGP